MSELSTVKSRRLASVVGAAMLPLVASTAALAGSAPDAGPTGDSSTAAPDVARLEEVVVTATRQKEALSKVPASVAALSQDTMDKQDVRDISDIARLVPGMSLTPLGSNDVSGTGRSISIRGISSTVGSATTGVYIDDTPIQVRSFGNDTTNVYPEVFDLERVEVLRGPQGTLFGAGAEGGAVRFITPQPSLSEYTAYTRAEFADTQGGALSYEAGGAIGGPIVDGTLGIRVSGWYRRDGGYIDRVDPTTDATLQSNANSTDSSVFRGAFALVPMDHLKVTFSAFNQNQYVNGSNSYFEDLSSPGNDRYRAANAVPLHISDRFTLPSLNVEYNAENFDVISTTSYFYRNVDRTVDYSAFIGAVVLGDPFAYGPGEYSEAFINDGQRSLTQELRIQSNQAGRFNWVLGAFYAHSRQSTFQLNYDPYINAALGRLGAGGFPLLNGTELFQTGGSSVDEQKALFGQADFEVLAGLKLIGGVRVAKTNLDAERDSEGPIAGPGGVHYNTSQSETPLTPKYGISYQVDPANLLYATASKGFRIGGINGPQIADCQSELAAIGLSDSPTSYKSDSVWSYEVGSKSRLLGGAIQIDASAYDIEWKNIQRGISLSGCGSGFVTNLGSARSRGFDLAINARPVDGLTLGTSFAYTDARLTQDVLGPTNSAGVTTVYARNGDALGVIPWSATASGEYEFPVPIGAKGYGRVDFQHVGGTPAPDYTIFGADPEIGGTDSYNDTALRVGMRTAGVDVSLFVNNLFDASPVLARLRYTTAASDQLFLDGTLRPRTFGVTATYRY